MLNMLECIGENHENRNCKHGKSISGIVAKGERTNDFLLGGNEQNIEKTIDVSKRVETRPSENSKQHQIERDRG